MIGRGRETISPHISLTCMDDFSFKAMWERLDRTVRGWIGNRDDESGEDGGDPDLLFHLVVAAPVLFGVLAMLRSM